MTGRPTRELKTNFRISVGLLGSGWAAIMYCDVTDDDGTYSDVWQTGIGRYETEAEAKAEAIQWSRADNTPLEDPLFLI